MSTWKSLAKRARPLFALAAASCATDLGAAYPLCDERGSPACGNIGQVGRPTPTPSTSSPIERIATDLSPRGGIPLLAMASTAVGIGLAATTIAVIAWPHDDNDNDIYEEYERDPTSPPIVVVAPSPPPPEPTLPVAVVETEVAQAEDECANRPLTDDQCRPACGNVIKHGKGGSWCKRAR